MKKGVEPFAAGIGISDPWYIKDTELKDTGSGPLKMELHIWVDFRRGARFEMDDGKKYTAYDTVERTWRHLNFFQHICYIHARVPRVQMADGRTLQAEVPWARPGSSYTLLFEAECIGLVQQEMSLAQVGRRYGIDSRRIGRMINWYVTKALNDPACAGGPVEVLGVDETSIKKRHNYITIVSDLLNKRVVAIEVGKDKDAVDSSLDQMEARGIDTEQVKLVCMDLSPAYISAAMEYLPKATIVFDRFHLDKLLGQAIDELRRAEQTECKLLKKTRFLWLCNPNKLSASQSERLTALSAMYPTMGEAYRLKLLYKEIWNSSSGDEAEKELQIWMQEAGNSGIFPLQKFVRTLKAHWTGIVAYFRNRVTNALAERINLKIQEAKRRARGYANIENFINIIYLLCGNLKLSYPQ